MINFKISDFCKLLRLCAISALQISKKHFAMFDFFVKTKLVLTVWVSTSLSKFGYCESTLIVTCLTCKHKVYHYMVKHQAKSLNSKNLSSVKKNWWQNPIYYHQIPLYYYNAGKLCLFNEPCLIGSWFVANGVNVHCTLGWWWALVLSTFYTYCWA